jgi:hypothetical protein
MTPSTYNDDDMVYVDPESRTVVGKVEWGSDDLPQSLPYQAKEGDKSWRKFFPWGTYRSMKGAFRIEGRKIEEESAETLDQVLPKMLRDEL